MHHVIVCEVLPITTMFFKDVLASWIYYIKVLRSLVFLLMSFPLDI